MNDNQSQQQIIEFANTVKRDSQAEVDDILSKAKAECDRIVETARHDLAAKTERRVDNATRRYERDSQRRVSQQSFLSGQAVLKKRSQLVDDFFAGLENKLQNFADSPQYDVFFARQLSQANASRSLDHAQIRVRGKDVSAVQQLYPRANVSADPLVRIGGAKLYYEADNVYADLTLDYQLKLERTQFIEKSELRL
jgi:vacuolar-type H+-ATPase subunit E/Vma4